MSFAFDPNEGLIIVPMEVWGPSGSAVLQLALDTGATATLINAAMLVALGYDPATVSDRVQITTGSGVEFVPRLSVDRVAAVGLERSRFAVLCHTLPPSTGVDGLLGLDFLRDRIQKLDFRRGRLTIA